MKLSYAGFLHRLKFVNKLSIFIFKSIYVYIFMSFCAFHFHFILQVRAVEKKQKEIIERQASIELEAAATAADECDNNKK